MTTIPEAKSSLKRILLENNGDTTQPAVEDAIKTLQILSSEKRGEAEWNVTQDKHFHTGRWRTITTPPFPGRLPDDGGKAKYTLGRMSFNMFKPTKAVCAIDEIVNVVEALDDDSSADQNGSSWEQSYNSEVLMEISVSRTKEGSTTEETIVLPAKLISYGVCTPTSPTRIGVTFQSGTLKPNFDMTLKENEIRAKAWKETFEGAIAKEAEAQSILSKLATIASNVLMKLMMGLDPPVDCMDFTQTYTIARPIAGHLDILYMDEDLRISKGNRGTIVVVERI
ncbi:hypothetical protein HJC23_008143 [Cyclotella cryptica]|uniref:Plastid lipid-associated protein/fibrillin conserved domain-containing protein n=1 Tax=Cyclotella cryptica TaxID=29204 RepID=A0ABD3PJT0_9STRA|eukprot:CCRYP_013991-RA/>CCRYP_013991-RA protein AED:0.10 eAED:0.10 QI:161/-1/1/1/-1/1/1/100/281